MTDDITLGIVGGNGALGSAIARALLRSETIAPGRLHISCRSGAAPALADWPGITVTSDNQALAEACDVILLAVPPAAMGEVAIRAPDALVISVMAGVTAARIGQETGARAVIRAMSSPEATDLRLAFSPYWAGPGATDADRATAHRLLAATGETAELSTEDQIDRFTALTGPVPGFVALFAEVMQSYAERHGTPPDVSATAIRQLFRAAGEILARSGEPPAAHVDAMITYAGTTAAGLTTMKAGPLAEAIAEGLDAAVARARQIG